MDLKRLATELRDQAASEHALDKSYRFERSLDTCDVVVESGGVYLRVPNHLKDRVYAIPQAAPLAAQYDFAANFVVTVRLLCADIDQRAALRVALDQSLKVALTWLDSEERE
jgi:hypothetical protein